MPKPQNAAEVLKLFDEALRMFFLAQGSGTTNNEVLNRLLKESVESLKSIELRAALHIWCTDDARTQVIRMLAPFDGFPTKKVRFNVFPQSEEKLERVAKARGIKTKKDSIDTVLEFLVNGLPLDYWNRTSEVATLLSEHLPSSGHATPVSLAMNSLGYALLQDVADILDQPQGAVLEAATEMWLTELKSVRTKTEKALKIIDEFHSQALTVEKQLKEIFDGVGPKIFDGAGPIYDRFGFVMVDLENLLMAIESNINKGVPIASDDSSQTG